MPFTITGESVAFFILALLTIGGAVFMISFTKVVHMVVALAFTFLSIAGIFIMLEAEFVAFVQVLIYSGAVSILMLFGIMMTKHDQEESAVKRPVHTLGLWVGILSLFGFIFYSIQQSVWVPGEYKSIENNVLEIGLLMFSEFVIPFEIASVLLTVALIGAIVLAKREEEPK